MNLMNRAQILGSAMTLLAFLNTEPAAGQGLQNSETIDAIVGTPVHEEETQAAADPGKVISAIEKTDESAALVRKTSSLDNVDIIFLADSTVTEGGPPPEIEAKMNEFRDGIIALRQEIEGNAMIYHALDSRQVLLRDVVAVEFNENTLVIYAAAAKPRTTTVP